MGIYFLVILVFVSDNLKFKDIIVNLYVFILEKERVWKFNIK